MRKFAPKALFSILAIGHSAANKSRWERTISFVAGALAILLVAIYVFGAARSRW